MKFSLSILLLLAFALNSCDIESNIAYKITNNSSKNLRIICTNKVGVGSTDTFNLEVNRQLNIAIILQGLNRVSAYKEKGETLRSFSRIDIFQHDAVPAVTDFLKTERWTYDEIGSHTADYVLTVIDSDF